MPATRHALTNFPPQRVYLDTNFLLSCLFTTYPYHAEAGAFMVNLATSDVTTLYVSANSWVEFAHVLCRPDFRDGLPDDLQDRFQLAAWDDWSVRETYVDYWLSELQGLLDNFAWYEIGVTADVRVHALQLLVQFQLKGLDATHVACAQAANVLDLVSFDRDFRRIDGLHLWTV